MELDIITMCDEPWGDDYKNEMSFEKNNNKKTKLSDMLPILSRMKRGSTKTTE